MPPLEARRSERIDYHAPVELLAHVEGVAAPHRVLARSLDLGQGGMQLFSPVQMEVGAHVTCRVTLDGQPASLPGRVAWLKARDAKRHGDGHGMGICFDPLGSHESGLLQELVERSRTGFRAVQLHFEGLDQPVVAHGRAHAGGLRLSAALPVLTRGTELSFRLEEDGPLFKGRIGNAAITDALGARRLEVDVDVDEWERVRFRRNARYGSAAEIEADEASAALEAASDPVMLPLAAPSEMKLEPKRAWRTPWIAMLIAAACGASASWMIGRNSRKPPRAAEFIAHPRPAAPPAPEARAKATDPVVSPTSEPSLPRGAASPLLAAPTTWVQTAASPTSPAAARAAAPAPVAAPEPTEARAAESSAPARQLEPEVIEGDQETTLRIPYDGALADMKARIWAVPHALAVDLPGGTTSLELGRHPVNTGGVTDLQLNKLRDKLLLRVKVAAPIESYRVVSSDTNRLELRIRFERGRPSEKGPPEADGTPASLEITPTLDGVAPALPRSGATVDAPAAAP